MRLEMHENTVNIKINCIIVIWVLYEVWKRQILFKWLQQKIH
jgi:hypothetical protein